MKDAGWILLGFTVVAGTVLIAYLLTHQSGYGEGGAVKILRDEHGRIVGYTQGGQR